MAGHDLFKKRNVDGLNFKNLFFFVLKFIFLPVFLGGGHKRYRGPFLFKKIVIKS